MTHPSPLRITLAGSLGSGKSTVGSALEAHFQIPLYSTGALFRALAAQNKISALQANLDSEENFNFDHYVDDFIKDKNVKEQDFIFDSRMAWHFVDNSVDLFLYCPTEVAAARISRQTDRVAEQQKDAHLLIEEIHQRRASEVKRYSTLYGVDIEDLANYSLVIDTSATAPEVIVAKIIACISDGTNGAFASDGAGGLTSVSLDQLRAT